MKKGITVLLLLLAACMLFSACSTGAAPASSTAPAASGASSAAPASTAPSQTPALLDKPVTLRLLTTSAANWPWSPDWYVGKMIKEKTNVTLDFILTDDSSMNDKINTMMASGDVPELTWGFSVPEFKKYGGEGAYANILDNLGSLPTFSVWKDQNNQYVSDFLSADGKLYVMPDQGIQETDRQCWLYRKDIFDKNGLSVPTNETEFFNTLMKLKEIYPDSYPFAWRDQLYKFEWLAPSWGTGFPGDHALYYDPDKQTWKFGPAEDNFKTMVEFYNKLYVNKLIPPDILTIDTKGWQDLLSTDKAFVTFDYIGRIDFFNNAMRPTEPGYSLVYMAPWKGGTNGVAKVAYSGYANSGFAISAKSTKLQETLKYVDWMYTDQAKELLSWGEEGKTYTVVDGKKKFIGVNDMASMRKTYGLSTNGYYALFDYDAHISLFSKELAEAVPASREGLLAPYPSVAMTDDELNQFNQIFDSVNKYVNDNVSKFIIGERPLTDWDAYVKDLENLGVQKLIDIQTTAYNRQMGK